MSTLIAIVAVLLMIAGAVFIFAAALGLMRFADPLQRMHAATKAGTIGAVMMLLGTVLVHEQPGSTMVGIVAAAFLLMTVPVAAHLLGRAVYVSGAQLRGLPGRDALRGQLTRSAAPLEQRIDIVRPHPAADAPASDRAEERGQGAGPQDAR